MTELKKMPWTVDGLRKEGAFMSDYYDQYLRPFGELLTEMERNGIKVDTTGHLKDGKIYQLYLKHHHDHSNYRTVVEYFNSILL